MMKFSRRITVLLAVVSLPVAAATPTDWVTTYSASDNYGGSYGTITFNDWGYTGPTGVGANDFVVGSGFDSGNIGQIQSIVTKAPDWNTSDPTSEIYTDPLAKDQYGNFYPPETLLTNANMDSSVNFYKWGYTTPTSTFSNMQIDREGNYSIARNDMTFGYYQEFLYNNGTDPVQPVDTGIDFQPYAISDAKGWCGSVLVSDPNGLEEMAGQVTFDFAFDVYFGGTMATQVIPDFVMRSYGDYEVSVSTAGGDLQSFSGSAVVNNTNPETGLPDADYHNQVSFLGGGVIPATIWVINEGTPDVEIVAEGTAGATLHTNTYGGYAFLLRADANRTLEWISPDGHSVYVSTVPVPPALWLFASGLAGLIGFSKRRRNRL